MNFNGFKSQIGRIFALFVLFSGMPALAHIVDGESRQTPEEFFAQSGAPAREAFSSSGNLYCGLAGIDVTAQVVLQNDLLLTAAHPFFNASTRDLKSNLDRCFFEPFFGAQKGRRFRLRLETLRFYSKNDQGQAGFEFKTEYHRDLALVRLDLAQAAAKYGDVGFQPYAVEVPALVDSPLTGPAQFLLSAVDGGPRTAYDFSPALQSCRVRDQSLKAGAALILHSDCDVQNIGPSGAALLKPQATGFAVTGIMLGHYGKKPGPYGKTSNAALFVGMNAAVKSWIAAYLKE